MYQNHGGVLRFKREDERGDRERLSAAWEIPPLWLRVPVKSANVPVNFLWQRATQPTWGRRKAQHFHRGSAWSRVKNYRHWKEAKSLKKWGHSLRKKAFIIYRPKGNASPVTIFCVLFGSLRSRSKIPEGKWSMAQNLISAMTGFVIA